MAKQTILQRLEALESKQSIELSLTDTCLPKDFLYRFAIGKGETSKFPRYAEKAKAFFTELFRNPGNGE